MIALSAEPRVPPLATRRPAAREMMRAGIWVTRPSPTESLVKMSAAAASDRLCRVTPMTMPPKMLTARMMSPAMASPRTNFDAPSIEPKKALSSSSSRRRACATFSSMRPAERSASIAICFPGMASRVKTRADLGDAGRALGDDQEVDRHQDEKDDDADDEIAAHHQLGETADDIARRRQALFAAREDEPGGRNVERESEDRRHQEHGREGRELERLMDPQSHHQDQNGERNREREAEVDHERRDGQEEQAQDKDDADGEGDVLAAAVRRRRRSRRRQ